MSASPHVPPPQPPKAADSREARLFRNNRSQAVRIPADFELPGDRVRIWREGGRLVVEPVAPPGLLGLLASWEPLDEDLPLPDDPAPAPEEVL